MKELITAEEAIKAGKDLESALTMIRNVDKVNDQYGKAAAGLYQIVAQRKFTEVMSRPEIKALIIEGAGTSYEVAESDRYKVPPEKKFEGAMIAMKKGYDLYDEMGPTFTVICGKGGVVNVMIKALGHRRRLESIGAADIEAKAVAREMRKRPNSGDEAKFDMLIDAKASCVINGTLVETERSGEYPLILPCYESDGPDGHEAKAKRRILRDLWEKVSGVHEPVDASELAADVEPDADVIDADFVVTDEPSDPWAEEKARLQSPRAQAAWDKLAEARDEAEIESLMKHAAKVDMHTKDRQSLQRFADFLTGKAS